MSGAIMHTLKKTFMSLIDIFHVKKKILEKNSLLFNINIRGWIPKLFLNKKIENHTVK
jgi:hypothetical protein